MSVRVGVVGVGAIGEHHVRNYATMGEADLVGIYDINLDRAQRIAEVYGTIVYEDLHQLLKDTQAISLCVPTSLHKDVAFEIIDEGIDLLVEKPISFNLEDADQIINRAAQNGVKLMVGHVERFNPAVLTLKEVIKPEEIVYIEAQRLGPFVQAREEVGVILDLMIHDIDIFLDLIDSPIRKINSLAIKERSQTEDVAHAQILFENGVAAVLSASRITQRKVRTLNVTQKNSLITADYLSQEILIRSGLTPQYVGGKNVSYKQVATVEIPYVQRAEPLRLELKHFLSCVQNKQTPEVSGQEGRRALQVALDVLARSQA